MYKKNNNKGTLMRLLRAGTIMFIAVIFSWSSCKKSEEETPSLPGTFFLSSPAIGTDSLLPAEYTCDGAGSTLPLSWTGYPSSTACFALLMHHVASLTDIHWYWIIYNIPPEIHALAKNITGIGILGTNSVNDLMEFAPPCSQGPGRKDYILTVYALSEMVKVAVPPEEVDREVFLSSIRGIKLDSAAMTVWYSRNVE